MERDIERKAWQTGRKTFSAALQRVGDFDHAFYSPQRSLPSLLRDPFDPCFLIFSISASRSSRPLILHPISLAFKSEAIMVRFHVVHERLGQALEGLPDELCLSDEVEKQIFYQFKLFSLCCTRLI
ncbi:uncharacterized protein LOC126603491 [Malus sylvestris]|uniref:uncharacterized protein LOC126603491 n=1 Tax=Malus sylvestris TaxID=3752 RepID=UPI0021AD4775|nr:uncharacterized protein LOC126603491 [Malus sylvestris]